MLHRISLALLPLALMTGCASITPRAPGPAHSLVGNWDNAAQMAAAPEALKRPPVAGGAYEWVDGQYAQFFPVRVPAIAGATGQAVYLIWRNNGPDGPVSRQRLWVFVQDAQGKLGMDFYAFKDPKPFENARTDSSQFAALSLNDLTIYGPACTLPVQVNPNGWSASIPNTCAITARSGRKMVLSAEINLIGDTLSYREAGVLESGAFAFKVPGGPAYQFIRQRGGR